VKVKERLFEEGIRVELDDRRETLGYRIRDNQLKKVPYMLIIGDKEVESKRISVRTRDGKEFKDVEILRFLEKIKEEIRERRRELTENF
jgi:threonyl-tRNA synthetase